MAPPVAYPMLVREKVAEQMALIKPPSFTTTVVTVENNWPNWLNLRKEKLPGIYVTNEADQGDLLRTGKFSQRCAVDEILGINIMGRYYVTTEQVAEDLGEIFLADVKGALLLNPMLGGLVQEIRDWRVRRPAPWMSRDFYVFQVLVRYGATVRYV